MSTTIIPDANLSLTPIASVDTSSVTEGVAMFSLLFNDDILDIGNILQIEYWVSEEGTPLPAVSNGFITSDEGAITRGISNFYNIAIPLTTNEYQPSPQLNVKVRIYIGETTTTGPEIRVTGWSNECPLHSAPPQPGEPTAYIFRGGYPDNAPYVADTLYVQIPYNASYIEGEIDFIISYSYKDVNGNYQWIVSSPISNWVDVGIQNIISLSPLVLAIDVDYSSPLYVAVNAIYNYEFNGNNYYTVSEISQTVEAVNSEFGAPILNAITTDDYLIYSEPSAQTVILRWQAPTISEIIPAYAPDRYRAQLIVDDIVVSEIDDISNNVFECNFNIPSEYITISSTTLLTFNVVAIYDTGEEQTSNNETIYTFKYATIPTDLIVAWANEGDEEGLHDFAIQFSNPESIGFGTAPYKFVVNIVDNSNNEIKATQDVSYNSTLNYNYAVFFENVSTTPIGTVEVYMVTTDTNQTNNEYLPRDGAMTSANYISSKLPIFINVERTELVLQFDIVTSTLLDAVNRFIYFDLSGQQLNANNTYLAIPGIYRDASDNIMYEVVLETNETGDYQYNFNFFPAYGEGDPLPQHMTILAANGYGIGHYTFNSPIP